MGEPVPRDQRKEEGVVSLDGSKTEEREQMRANSSPLPQPQREARGRGGAPAQVRLSQTHQRLSSAETPRRQKCTTPENETIDSFS